MNYPAVTDGLSNPAPPTDLRASHFIAGRAVPARVFMLIVALTSPSWPGQVETRIKSGTASIIHLQPEQLLDVPLGLTPIQH